ncbi:uncharacterized protein LOC129602625 [Paramacrobiotus metropolitanus]|uniref:uncharacterized protein LOC129602625 n=1 Tax=Paramacrobiotus metropolitanus TaxID=2943436 RepID=UPI002445CB31|nr:uncharacterized protein LOC129602625 [Paramacrobiotus metropolitanus]
MLYSVSLLALLGAVANLGYAAPNPKPAAGGKTVKMIFWQAICNQEIAYEASSTEEDCLAKCKADHACLFASYNSKEVQCGLVPANFDCIFQRRSEENMLLGVEKKKFTPRMGNIDTKALTNNKGDIILDGALGVSTDDCTGLCNIQPKCKVAQVSAGGHGPQACTLKGISGPTKRLGMTDMSVAYVAS